MNEYFPIFYKISGAHYRYVSCPPLGNVEDSCGVEGSDG
jgi:hypothetical protein